MSGKYDSSKFTPQGIRSVYNPLLAELTKRLQSKSNVKGTQPLLPSNPSPPHTRPQPQGIQNNVPSHNTRKFPKPRVDSERRLPTLPAFIPIKK